MSIDFADFTERYIDLMGEMLHSDMSNTDKIIWLTLLLESYKEAMTIMQQATGYTDEQIAKIGEPFKGSLSTHLPNCAGT